MHAAELHALVELKLSMALTWYSTLAFQRFVNDAVVVLAAVQAPVLEAKRH